MAFPTRRRRRKYFDTSFSVLFLTEPCKVVLALLRNCPFTSTTASNDHKLHHRRRSCFHWCCYLSPSRFRSLPTSEILECHERILFVLISPLFPFLLFPFLKPYLSPLPNTPNLEQPFIAGTAQTIPLK